MFEQVGVVDIFNMGMAKVCPLTLRIYTCTTCIVILVLLALL